MEYMSLLRPQKRARQELSIQARMERASTDERFTDGIADIALLGLEPCGSFADKALIGELAVSQEVLIEASADSLKKLLLTFEAFAHTLEGFAHTLEGLAFSYESPATSHDLRALSHEEFATSHKLRAWIYRNFPKSPLFSDRKTSAHCFPSKTQSNLEPQTQPQLHLQQQLVGLDLQNCFRQILLLSATDVIETLLLRLNHYLEEWKKARGLRPGRSIPSSYSDMVYLLLKSQLRPWFIEAMDDVESAFLHDLQERGYGPTIELKEGLRQDLTAFLTKAKREGGRNDVAHIFSTTVKQYWKNSSQAPGKVRCLLGTVIGDLTQSQKDYTLRILDLLSKSQNLPECYRDLAQVAFPLQIFFLRDVIEKSEVRVEIVGG